MQSSRDIKRRIRSVKNIAQITKAMEVVSMTKMRRTQQFALAARPYAVASLRMLENLLAYTPEEKLPKILKARDVKIALLVIVTTDKGLVGGFNENILRKADAWIKAHASQSIKIITVGKKAKEFADRHKIVPVESFNDFGDYVEFQDTKGVANAVLKGFLKGEWDAATVVYTQFKTTLRQETAIYELLPSRKESIKDIVLNIVPEYGRYSNNKGQEKDTEKYSYSYTFEPHAETILGHLAENLIRIAMHHVLLESNASEHSARMVTMKNASENAAELESKLVLEFNKVRQASITSEISEIVAGSEALQ